MRAFFCDTLHNSWNTALFFIKQLLLCKLSDGTGYIYKRRVEFSPGTENSTSRHRDRERAAHDMGVLTYSHLTVIHPRKDKGKPENLGNTTSSHNDPENTGSFHKEQEMAATSPPQPPHASADAPLRMRTGGGAVSLSEAAPSPRCDGRESRCWSEPRRLSRAELHAQCSCCEDGDGLVCSVASVADSVDEPLRCGRRRRAVCPPPLSGGMVHPAGARRERSGGEELWWLRLPVLEIVLLVRNYR